MILGSTVLKSAQIILVVMIRLMITGNSWTYYSTTMEVFELIIIGVYGSTVFGMVGFIFANDCFLLTDGIVT
jgi:hypothetical protein